MSRLGGVSLFFTLIFLIVWLVFLSIPFTAHMPFIWVALGLAGASLGLSVYTDFTAYKEVFSQRATKHGMNLGALVLIVLALLAGLNFMGFRYSKKYDFTKDKLNSLSEQTVKILRGLDTDLTVMGFFESTKSQAGLRDREVFKAELAKKYEAESSKVKISFVDPVDDPGAAKANDVKSSSVVILKYKDKTARFETLTEEAFTNAIIQVTRTTKKTIYLLTGHGEHGMDDTKETGASQVKAAMSEASYEVKALDFITTPAVPADAAAVLVLGPEQALFEKETAALREYLYGGGNLMLAADPEKKHQLAAFIKELGVEYEGNFVIDLMGQQAGGSAAFAIGFQYSGTNDITKSFRNTRTVFYLASGLKPVATKIPGIDVEEIVKSSPASFPKTDLKNESKVAMGTQGSITVVAAAKGKLSKLEGKAEPKDFQVIVAGDSDFMANGLFEKVSNRDLAMNSVAYLAKEKDLVSIRPKQRDASQFMMTPTQKSIFSLIIFPGTFLLFLGCTGFVWYRRRAA